MQAFSSRAPRRGWTHALSIFEKENNNIKTPNIFGTPALHNDVTNKTPRGIVMKHAAGLAALLLCLAAQPAWAAYPERAITLIVPAAAGGNADITARLVGQEMSKLLGQPVVVENRVGAGGRIGTQALVRAPADGYTIGYAHVGTLVLHRYLFKQQLYDLTATWRPSAWSPRRPTSSWSTPRRPTAT